MKLDVKFTDKDLGFDKIKKLKNHYVDVGVFGKEDAEMVIIAAVHEFGNPKNRFYGKAKAPIPARPFIRPAIDNSRKEILKFMDKHKEALFVGKMSPQQYFNKLGVMMEAAVVKYMNDSSNFAENSDLTKKLKGSSKPLYDTGHLQQSITFIIDRIG